VLCVPPIGQLITGKKWATATFARARKLMEMTWNEEKHTGFEVRFEVNHTPFSQCLRILRCAIFGQKKTPIFTNTPARFRPWRQAWRCSPGIVGFQVGSREFVAATFQQSHATPLHAKEWCWTSNWGKGGRTNMASNHKLINRETLQVFGPNACRISYHASMPKPTVSKVKV